MQEVPDHVRWEVILVDNASSDATATIAEQVWRKHNVVNSGFAVITESTQGRIHAFRTGMGAAKFEYILTCDDDNWLNPHYVARAFQIMEANPTVGVLGGCGIFEPEHPLNPDVKGFSYYFVNGSQTWANTEHWVYGAGSIYRKSIIVALIDKGWKQITTGRKGSSLLSGDDVEICFMIYLSGFKIIADDLLTFKHFVPLTRQNIAYILGLSFWLSYSHVLMNSYYPILNDDKRPISEIINKWLLGATKTYAKNLVLLGLKKLTLRKRLTVEERIKFNTAHGTWCALVKNRQRIIDHHKQTVALLAGRTVLTNDK